MKLRLPRLTRALAATSFAALAGCASVNPRLATVETAQVMRKGPQAAPFRSITNFSDGLRCMDVTLADYGVRDLSVIAEDLADATGKVSAGTKDMLISAISDMTRRSRAIRVIAFGQDSGNTLGFLDEAEQRDQFASVPRYGVRGSISQFDEAIVTNNSDNGLTLGTRVTLGATRNATGSVIGLDLAVLSTRDLGVVPGVTSRNSVLVVNDSDAGNAKATFVKFGLNFSLTTARQEGPSQALRTLVELAAIELFGRLAKVPYWSCLGASDADAAVEAEIRDWYDAMAANPTELIAYFQAQLRNRRVYGGPVDGVVNAEFGEAVSRYRELLGLSRDPKLSLEVFQAYLHADHRALASRITPVPLRPLASDGAGRDKVGEKDAGKVADARSDRSDRPGGALGPSHYRLGRNGKRAAGRDADDSLPLPPSSRDATDHDDGAPRGHGRDGVALPSSASPAGASPTAEASTTATPMAEPSIGLRLDVPGGSKRFARDAVIGISATVDRDAHLYCYLRDHDDSIRRVFPNRYAHDSAVRADRPLDLPGTDSLQLIADGTGVQEVVACFATQQDVAGELPGAAYGTDLEPLPVRSLNEIRRAFSSTTRNHFAEDQFHVDFN